MTPLGRLPAIADLKAIGVNSFEGWFWRRDRYCAPRWEPARVTAYRDFHGAEELSVWTWGAEDPASLNEEPAEWIPMETP